MNYLHYQHSHKYANYFLKDSNTFNGLSRRTNYDRFQEEFKKKNETSSRYSELINDNNKNDLQNYENFDRRASLKDQILSPGDNCSNTSIIYPKKSQDEDDLYQHQLNIKTNYFNRQELDATKKKTLILDLDETLVHSSFQPFNFNGKPINPDISLNILFEGEEHHCNVLKRPFVDDFLKQMNNYYTIFIFTASIREYADPLLDHLDKRNNFISKRFFREACTITNDGRYIKDLNNLTNNLKDVILIDNNPISYSFNKKNGIPIKTWHNDKSDQELIKIINLLVFLSTVEDVREYIPKVIDSDEINYSKVNSLIREDKSKKLLSPQKDLKKMSILRSASLVSVGGTYTNKSYFDYNEDKSEPLKQNYINEKNKLEQNEKIKVEDVSNKSEEHYPNNGYAYNSNEDSKSKYENKTNGFNFINVTKIREILNKSTSSAINDIKTPDENLPLERTTTLVTGNKKYTKLSDRPMVNNLMDYVTNTTNIVKNFSSFSNNANTGKYYQNYNQFINTNVNDYGRKFNYLNYKTNTTDTTNLNKSKRHRRLNSCTHIDNPEKFINQNNKENELISVNKFNEEKNYVNFGDKSVEIKKDINDLEKNFNRGSDLTDYKIKRRKRFSAQRAGEENEKSRNEDSRDKSDFFNSSKNINTYQTGNEEDRFNYNSNISSKRTIERMRLENKEKNNIYRGEENNYRGIRNYDSHSFSIRQKTLGQEKYAQGYTDYRNKFIDYQKENEDKTIEEKINEASEQEEKSDRSHKYNLEANFTNRTPNKYYENANSNIEKVGNVTDLKPTQNNFEISKEANYYIKKKPKIEQRKEKRKENEKGKIKEDSNKFKINTQSLNFLSPEKKNNNTVKNTLNFSNYHLKNYSQDYGKLFQTQKSRIKENIDYNIQNRMNYIDSKGVFRSINITTNTNGHSKYRYNF